MASATDGKPRVGFLFMSRERPGFDAEWGREVEARVGRFLDGSPYDAVVSEKVTDDRSLCAAVARCEEAGCDALVALQPTMSDGRFAPILAQRWGGPLVLWATPERPGGDRVSSCSLVGTHIFASTLRQLRRPFELVYGDPDEPRTGRELREAVAVSRASRLLKSAKIGLVGYHAPGFIDMHADPFDLNAAFGAQLRHFGIQDLVDGANGVEAAAVEEDVARVLDMGLPLEDVSGEDLPTSSCLYLAMKGMVEKESLDALAVQEWPELPNLTGQWPYLGILRLTMEGTPTAMEGDVDGALSSLVGEALGLGAAYISDWLEHDDEEVALWHMGNAPFEMCEPVGSPRGPRLAKHFNIPKPLVVNADLRADQPVTIFRLWRCDGRYYATARDATTATPKRDLLGTNALARPEGGGVRGWFERLLHAGMPHHVAVFRGHHEGLLRRFARGAGAGWVE